MSELCTLIQITLEKYSPAISRPTSHFFSKLKLPQRQNILLTWKYKDFYAYAGKSHYCTNAAKATNESTVTHTSTVATRTNGLPCTLAVPDTPFVPVLSALAAPAALAFSSCWSSWGIPSTLSTWNFPAMRSSRSRSSRSDLKAARVVVVGGRGGMTYSLWASSPSSGRRNIDFAFFFIFAFLTLPLLLGKIHFETI